MIRYEGVPADFQDIRLENRDTVLADIVFSIPNRRYGGDVRFVRRTIILAKIEPIAVEQGDMDADANEVNA